MEDGFLPLLGYQSYHNPRATYRVNTKRARVNDTVADIAGGEFKEPS